MEAPPLQSDPDTQPLHAWQCPLCHRHPVDPSIAECGHTYCRMCLKDVQVTAQLWNYIAQCKICFSDISDLQPVAMASHRILPPPTPATTAQTLPVTSNQPTTRTVGDALAAMHQHAGTNESRNHQASGWGSAKTAYTHQQMPHHMYSPSYNAQLPPYDGRRNSPHARQMYRDDSSQGQLPASDEVVNTIERSPHATTVSTSAELKMERQDESSLSYHPFPVSSQTGTGKASRRDGLKNLIFHLKGNLDSGEQARSIIERNGGRLSAGATRNTDYIVMGSGARKTKAMKEHEFAILDEVGFWALMKEKIGDVHEQYHSLVDNETELALEDAKLKAELARLEKKTADVKRRLEGVEASMASIKRQKGEHDKQAGLSHLSKFVEHKSES